MYQSNTLYTLNLHNIICQIYSIKKKKDTPLSEKNERQGMQ